MFPGVSVKAQGGTVSSSRLEERRNRRAWHTYEVIPIRRTGTIKTEKSPYCKEYGRRHITKGGNLVDVVRGCRGGVLYGNRGHFGDCYAKEASRRFPVLFNQPQRMEFKEDLLAKDVDRLDEEGVRMGMALYEYVEFPMLPLDTRPPTELYLTPRRKQELKGGVPDVVKQCLVSPPISH